jgi:SAM-dependent methyltransferase
VKQLPQGIRPIDQSLLGLPVAALDPRFDAHGRALRGVQFPTRRDGNRGETPGQLGALTASMGTNTPLQIIGVARVVAAVGKPEHVDPVQLLFFGTHTLYVFSVVGNRRLHNLWSRLIYLAFTEPFLLRAKRKVCSLIDELGKYRVLEVGCGTCLQSVMIARRGISVTGIDRSEALFPSPKSPRLPPTFTFFQADGRDLPFGNGQFDLALISMAIHEMEPAGRIPTLREMTRVLREDGVLLIMDFDFELESDRSLAALIIRIIERIAGKEHHRNFRHFMASGGIPRLLESLGYAAWTRHPILNNRGGVFQLRPYPH